MNIQDKRKLLESTKGKIFGITFVKQDNTIRNMTARLGVKKYLRGGVSTTTSKENILTTCDMQKAKEHSTDVYRNIPLDRVKEFRFAGNVVRF
jgi:hypothetical protein